MFYPWGNDNDPYHINTLEWTHKLINTLKPKEKDGKIILSFEIAEKRSGKESYVSLVVQDTNGYRYILPMHILSDDTLISWKDEQTSPRWRHYEN